MSVDEVMADLAVGTPKLWLTWKTLQLRKRRPEAFEGDYTPLIASGRDAAGVLAFSRGNALVTVVPRLVARHGHGNGGLHDRDARVPLHEGAWRDVLTGHRFTGDGLSGEGLAVGAILARFPVALLEREP